MNSTEDLIEPAASQARILVVDDRDTNVLLTRRILQKGGYVKVRTVTDSREALLLANTWNPDLVLLDLHMPHIGGTEFIRRVRGGRHPSKVPVLVLTADDDPAVLKRATEAGADECLVKPVDAAELLVVVHRLLTG